MYVDIYYAHIYANAHTYKYVSQVHLWRFRVSQTLLRVYVCAYNVTCSALLHMYGSVLKDIHDFIKICCNALSTLSLRQ